MLSNHPIANALLVLGVFVGLGLIIAGLLISHLEKRQLSHAHQQQVPIPGARTYRVEWVIARANAMLKDGRVHTEAMRELGE